MDPALYTTTAHLTDEEFMALDGKCRPEIQTLVDQAKQRMDLTEIVGEVEGSPRLVGILADIVRQTLTVGEMALRSDRIRGSFRTNCCGESAGYHAYTRTTQYHSKGDPNYDRPKELPLRRLSGHTFCSRCAARYAPVLAQALADAPAEIPAFITGEAPRFKRHEMLRCRFCDWRGRRDERGNKGGRACCPGCETIERSLFASHEEKTFEAAGWVLMQGDEVALDSLDRSVDAAVEQALEGLMGAVRLEALAHEAGATPASLALDDE